MRNSLLSQYRDNIARSTDYSDGSDRPTARAPEEIRLIAFFLPQFHAIPQNDRWWGEGFTEWTNVAKSLPFFDGHYQPRMPGAFGFYDLSDPECLRRQADTARSYGVEGFCFHHYWFGGQRLLEKPLGNLLADRSIDLPFCINWANENWTRRWDGQEADVLMAQAHSPHDDIAFARSIEPMFDDKRYIRVGGRPLLMIYRPAILPDARATIERWREHFARRGDNPMILMAQGFGDLDPRPYGLDAAVGFPPNGIAQSIPPYAPSTIFDPAYVGSVRRYDDLAEKSLAYRPDDFLYFPGVCPAWDNSARRGANGAVFQGSTPAKYGRWLETAGRGVLTRDDPDERIVFVNAWNEWAEGAYLEPDRHFGFAYLDQTALALKRLREPPQYPLEEVLPDQQSTAQAERWAARFARRVARKGARIADRISQRLASF
jgi:lipopolysaccharide biosynthesis protein